MKEHRDFIEGMFNHPPSDPKGSKYFNWDAATGIILAEVVNNPACTIRIGLREDWGWTSDTIYVNGEFTFPSMAYLKSYWATPIIDVDDREIECWSRKETPRPHWVNQLIVKELDDGSMGDI